MSCYKCFVYVCASFPGGTNERLLAKFHAQHQSSSYYGVPQMKEDVFLIVHYAGLVKYHIQVSDTPDRHDSDVDDSNDSSDIEDSNDVVDTKRTLLPAVVAVILAIFAMMAFLNVVTVDISDDIDSIDVTGDGDS